MRTTRYVGRPTGLHWQVIASGLPRKCNNVAIEPRLILSSIGNDFLADYKGDGLVGGTGLEPVTPAM
jgi:hypothetical protein